MQLPDLDRHRLALVTGATGGIGAAVCRTLSDGGWHIAASDIGFADDVPADGRLTHYVSDLSEPGAPDELMKAVIANSGLPDALVNAAGVYQAVDILETRAEYIDRVHAVNVRAPLLLTRVLAEQHIRAGTSAMIVNIASISGHIGSPDAAYGASKGALIAFTKGAGRALAHHQIRVNAVAPGIVDTDMTRTIPPDRLVVKPGFVM